MPLIKSAKKKARQAIKNKARNSLTKQKLRDGIRAVRDAVNAKDVALAKKVLPNAFKQIDIAAKKHVLLKNTASRRKSMLARLVSGLEKK